MGFRVNSKVKDGASGILGFQDEQLERAGMWLELGGKDERDEATGTRGVPGILKVRTELELHTEKADGRGLLQ